jgi:hypothetical protein
LNSRNSRLHVLWDGFKTVAVSAVSLIQIRALRSGGLS